MGLLAEAVMGETTRASSGEIMHYLFQAARSQASYMGKYICQNMGLKKSVE